MASSVTTPQEGDNRKEEEEEGTAVISVPEPEQAANPARVARCGANGVVGVVDVSLAVGRPCGVQEPHRPVRARIAGATDPSHRGFDQVHGGEVLPGHPNSASAAWYPEISTSAGAGSMIRHAGTRVVHRCDELVKLPPGFEVQPDDVLQFTRDTGEHLGIPLRRHAQFPVGDLLEVRPTGERLRGRGPVTHGPLGSHELVGDPGCVVSERGRRTRPAQEARSSSTLLPWLSLSTSMSSRGAPCSPTPTRARGQRLPSRPPERRRSPPTGSIRQEYGDAVGNPSGPTSPRSSRVDGPPLTDPTGPALARNPSRRSPNASKVTRGSADRCAAAATGRRRFVALLCGDSRGARTPVPSRLDRTLEGHFGQSFPGRRPSDGGMRPWPSFSFSQATGGTRLAVA